MDSKYHGVLCYLTCIKQCVSVTQSKVKRCGRNIMQKLIEFVHECFNKYSDQHSAQAGSLHVELDTGLTFVKWFLSSYNYYIYQVKPLVC